MMENGDKCFKCGQFQMPRWNGANARACQNCLAIEAKNKCTVKSCRKLPAIMIDLQGLKLEVCLEHSRMDFGEAKRMMERGEI